MKKKSSRKLLRLSCAWIRDHWDAHNLDVPADLLQQWTYQSDGDDLEPSGFHLAVFTFGYFQHDLISSQVPTGAQRSFPASLIVERFNRWQMKLALAEIHRHTDMRVRPLPLFAFPEDERIDFWRAEPNQAPR